MWLANSTKELGVFWQKTNDLVDERACRFRMGENRRDLNGHRLAGPLGLLPTRLGPGAVGLVQSLNHESVAIGTSRVSLWIT